MKLLKPSPEEAEAGLRAMAMVARAPGAIAEPARALIGAAQKILLGSDRDLDRLDGISPAELARALPRPEIRRQLVEGMVVVSLSAGEPPVAQSDLVERFADALAIEMPALRALRRIAHREILLYELCVVRNGHLPDMVKNVYAHEGLVGVAKAVLGVKGLAQEPEVAARYHALEKLPEDRVGKRLWHHYRDNGFKFPGEKGGFPEAGVYHDVSHVLAGYNTTPEGETLVGAFTAGYRQSRADHGFFTALFVVSIFSTGVDVTPIDVGARTGTIGKVAEEFFEAIDRGSEVPVDLSGDWDFWPTLELTLEEARRRLRIRPKQGGHPWDYE
ncbi:MAG TPA: hypothetical protein VFD92_10750 [Candidatus Binatia bacterium]|nr:hypothetical protein [Candidatus Binatia bacterium]